MKIVAAAILDNEGNVHSVPAPGRHHHVIRLMVGKGFPTPIKGKQGFVLSDGTFVDRVAAKAIACAAGQLLPCESGQRQLYSEDVW